jgi:hypothetical protein
MTQSAVNAWLEFYGSKQIAPLVRELWLGANVDHSLRADIEPILALFQRFDNIRNITFKSLRGIPCIMQTIARLPALTSIIMDGCVYDHSEEPLLRLGNVSLFGDHFSDVEGNWPFTIQPELLKSLHVDTTTFPNFSSLPNLRILRVNCNRKAAAPVIQCLKFLARCHCPSLDTLIFHRGLFMDSELAVFDRSTVTLPKIPRLKIYHGPDSLVSLFIGDGSLGRASLWTSGIPERMADNLNILHALAPNLVMLAIDVIWPSAAIACAIHQFRDLEELYLKTKTRVKVLESMQACRLTTNFVNALSSC